MDLKLRKLLYEITVVVILFSSSSIVFAQHDEEDLHELTIEELMNVQVVSSTQESVPLSEAPSTTFVVTGEQIRKWGIRRLSELVDRLVPGAFSAEDFDDVILSFRGITADSNLRVLLLLNGHEYNTQWNNGPSSEAELGLLSDIKRVEVLIGPHTALYGSSATIAVINMITKNGRDFSGVAVNANYGSGDYRRADFTAGSEVNESLDYFISAGGLASNGLDHNDNGPLQISRFPPSYRFYTNVNYKNFEIMSRFTRSCRAFYIQTASTTRPNHWTNYDTFFISSRSNFTINDQMDGALELSYDTIQTQRYDFTLGTKLRAVGEDRYSAKFTGFYSPHKSHRLVLGAHYRRDDFGSDWSGDNFNFSTEIQNGQVTGIPADPYSKRVLTPYGRNVYSIFAQDSIELSQKYSLLAGFRYDRIEAPQIREPNSFSPRLALVVTPNQRTVLKAMFTSGASRQLNAAVTSPDAIGFGNPTIVDAQEPERLHSFEIAGSHQLNSQVEFSLSAFYNSLTNIFGLDPNVKPPLFRIINHGRIDYTGFEFVANTNMGRGTFVRIIHQYVHFGAVVDDIFNLLTSPDKEHPYNYPENISKVLVDHKINRHVSINANANLIWNNYGPAEGGQTAKTGFYSLINANLIWSLKPRTELQVSVYNLLNKRMQIHPLLFSEGNPARNFLPGRSFNINFNYQF